MHKQAILLFFALNYSSGVVVAAQPEPFNEAVATLSRSSADSTDPATQAALSEIIVISRKQRDQLQDAINAINIDDYERELTESFDRYWHSSERHGEFAAFHQKVATELSQVTISQDSMDVLSAKVTAVWDTLKDRVKCWFKDCPPDNEPVNAQLNQIISEFSDSAFQRIEPIQTAFLEQQSEAFADYANQQGEAAVNRLAQALADLTHDYFETLDVATIRTVALQISQQERQRLLDELIASNQSVEIPSGMAAASGALMLLMRKSIQRVIMRTVVAKILGSVLSKAVPIVGWVLIAKDVWDASQAKAGMELELREVFIAEYQNGVNSDLLYQQSIQGEEGSGKSVLLTQLRNEMETVRSKTLAEIENLLKIPEMIYANPAMGDYVNQRANQGDSLTQIGEDVVKMAEQFGVGAIRYLSPEQMLQMRNELPLTAPTKLLGKIAERHKKETWPRYQQWGVLMVEASAEMGIEPTALIIESNQPLQTIVTLFRQYRLSESEPAAKQGFWLAWQQQFDLSEQAGWNRHRFAQLKRHEAVILQLKALGVAQVQLLNLLDNANLLPQLAVLQAHSPNLVVGIVQRWSMTELVNAMDSPLLAQLTTIAQREPALASQLIEQLNFADLHGLFASGEMTEPVLSYYHEVMTYGSERERDQFVRTLKNEPVLATIYRDHGKAGVALYRHYYPNLQAGDHARQLALGALALVKDSYSYEELYDADLVQFATDYPWVPKWLTRTLYHWLPLVISLLLLFILAGIALRIFRWSTRTKASLAPTAAPMPTAYPATALQPVAYQLESTPKLIKGEKSDG
ncbi:MAG: hypothetical protein HQL49_03455 [Gammaproteobacteria bacterium]|nr:hypothetical protein [Gammaproteobacteria bacterium]